MTNTKSLIHKLEGQKITKIRTIGSWYDDGCIELIDDEDKAYRLYVGELMKIINDLTFEGKKKRKHTYLTITGNRGWKQ